MSDAEKKKPGPKPKIKEAPEKRFPDEQIKPEKVDKPQKGASDYWIWCEKGLETVWLIDPETKDETLEDGAGVKHIKKVTTKPGKKIICQNWCGVEMNRENQLPDVAFNAPLPKKYSLTDAELKKVKDHFKNAKMKRYVKGKQEELKVRYSILKISKA